MHATVRRYEGIDQKHSEELTSKINESLAPRLSKLPGFGGYYLIEAGNGVVTSVGFFETSEQADESTRVAASWIRDEKLDTMIPNAPKITGGKVTVRKTNGVAAQL
jgi:hypothetical protein